MRHFVRLSARKSRTVDEREDKKWVRGKFKHEARQISYRAQINHSHTGHPLRPPRFHFEISAHVVQSEAAIAPL